MPIKAMLRARFDFAGTETEELSFKEGETIYLLFKDDSGWAKGRKGTGEKGWFPYDYTEIVIDVENNINNTPQQAPPTPSSPPPASTSAPVVTQDNSPKPADPANIPEYERGRYYIVCEILTTEKTYSRNLNSILKYWLAPLRDGSIIEIKFLPRIFSNIESLASLHVKFLQDLEQRVTNWKEKQMIGDLFTKILPDMNGYMEYLKNHHVAIVTVNQLKEQKKNFANWILSVKDNKECEGLDLLSFLIMPVQRILRYKLFLEDLIKNTSAKHDDYHNLNQALQGIRDIAENVNEKIKEEENFQKLCMIQKSFVGNVKNIVEDHRKFIREGPLTKVCRKTDKVRWFFLFSDTLLYASVAAGPVRKSGVPQVGSLRFNNARQAQQSSQKFLYHRLISLATTKVKPMEDTNTLKNAFQILTTEEKSFTVYAETAEEKEGWVKDLMKITANQVLDNSAPVWIPDSEAKNCMICQKGFNLLQRRHHCRYCGKVVCGACSATKVRITHISPNPVRVCKTCVEDLKKNGANPPESAESSPALTRNNSFSDENKRPPDLPKKELSTPNLLVTAPPVSQENVELKKKVDELTQMLKEETEARKALEVNFQSQIADLTKQIEGLTTKINSMLNPPTRPPPPPK